LNTSSTISQKSLCCDDLAGEYSISNQECPFLTTNKFSVSHISRPGVEVCMVLLMLSTPLASSYPLSEIYCLPSMMRRDVSAEGSATDEVSCIMSDMCWYTRATGDRCSYAALLIRIYNTRKIRVYLFLRLVSPSFLLAPPPASRPLPKLHHRTPSSLNRHGSINRTHL
jgi:hypothetical protein